MATFTLSFDTGTQRLEKKTREKFLEGVIYLLDPFLLGGDKQYTTYRPEPPLFLHVVLRLFFARGAYTSGAGLLINNIALKWVRTSGARSERGGFFIRYRSEPLQGGNTGRSRFIPMLIFALLLLFLWSSVASSIDILFWLGDIYRDMDNGSANPVFCFLGHWLLLSTNMMSQMNIDDGKPLYGPPLRPGSSWAQVQPQERTNPRILGYRMVDDRDRLKRYALAWLTNRLSVARSVLRLFLTHFSTLPKIEPSKLTALDLTTVSPSSFLDMLGWKRRNKGENMSGCVESKPKVSMLQHCYATPTVLEILDPAEPMVFLASAKDLESWSLDYNMVLDRSQDGSLFNQDCLFLLSNSSDPSGRQRRVVHVVPPVHKDEQLRFNGAIDLTGQIAIVGSTPKFIGKYSYVYQGLFGRETVIQSIKSIYLILNELQVAIKVIRSVTDNIQSMKRVSPCPIAFYILVYSNILSESSSRAHHLGHSSAPKHSPFVRIHR